MRGIPLVTIIVAIWGAVLSTVLGAIKFHEYFRDRARLKVTFRPAVVRGFLTGAVLGCGIEAINVGRRPITLDGLELQLDDGMHWCPARVDLYSNREPPWTLTESQALSVWAPRKDVPLEKVQYAYARANDGRIYKSKPFTGEARANNLAI